VAPTIVGSAIVGSAIVGSAIVGSVAVGSDGVAEASVAAAGINAAVVTSAFEGKAAFSSVLRLPSASVDPMASTGSSSPVSSHEGIVSVRSFPSEVATNVSGTAGDAIWSVAVGAVEIVVGAGAVGIVVGTVAAGGKAVGFGKLALVTRATERARALLANLGRLVRSATVRPRASAPHNIKSAKLGRCIAVTS
jgi:hypothetical protein